MPHGEATMEELHSQMNAIADSIKARNALDEQRRKTDDLRDERIAKSLETLQSRTDDHGSRTKVLEVKWEAFFGQFGAFTAAMTTIGSLGESVKRIDDALAQRKGANKIIVIGIPILISIAMMILGILGFFLHEKANGQSSLISEHAIVASTTESAGNQ